jgi:PAS domain S-box-containing protein
MVTNKIQNKNRMIQLFGRRSLSKELAISLIILLILFEGVLLAYVYSRQSRFLLQELEKKADDYAEKLREVLVVPLWDYDDEQIGKIGLSFLQSDVIGEVHIKDARGKMLFSALGRQDVEGLLSRSVDITHKDQVIGHADLVFSLDAIEEDRAWLRNTILLVLVASLIVIFVTAIILLRVFMRKPLDILQKGIDRVALGDYGYSFEEIHHLELTGIADRIREMAADIQARENSLQDEVTVRKHTEEKIRESEAKGRALLNAMPDMMFQLDRNGCFLEYHGTQQDLFMAPDTFLGKKIDDVVPADLAGLHHQKSEQALKTRQLQIFEYKLPINGKNTYFECRMVAISDETIMAVVRNITENKQAAADKSRLEEQLRKAQKMEAIGTLAGGVAHDLNNVLSGLISYPELILMDLADDSPLKSSIMAIKKSGEKAANIVQDMLTLARRGVAVSEVVDLNIIITDYLKSPEYERLKQTHPELKLEISLEPELLGIAGSPVHLSKTVMNLVSNAAEALVDGGTVSITSENRYIDKPISGYDDIEEGDYVRLIVRDTGIGIAATDIERIFEPFYTKKAMGRSGTGLGMAVVWGTVKDHNGYIDVQSTEGRGTQFFIYLPACRRPSTSKTSRRPLDDYRGKGEFLLIVDDVKDQREIATGILTKLGYRVDAVSSGEAAVDYLKTRTADLLILDMIMDPGIDGLETYRRILELHPTQKAIIASGYSESERVKEAQKLGAGAYVKKPYLMEKMALAVREELDR